MLTSLLLAFITPTSFAHNISQQPATVLTNLAQAKAVGGLILSKDESSDLAVTYLTQLQLNQLSKLNHLQGKCAGFETLTMEEINQPGQTIEKLKKSDLKIKNGGLFRKTSLTWNESYQNLANQADADLLKQTVTWISSYPNRYNRSDSPNVHVEDLKVKLQEWLKEAPWKFQIELIQHQSTRQKTLRLSIPGKTNPQEVIVLGAHFDSINQSFFGNSELAPGADDNASGSANLIEALKILKKAEQPQRTLEFYWYAGEESGLLGSAEIAKEAKAKKKNVIAVLQLDMTLFPGSGEQVIGLVNDYTSPWLREMMTSINEIYVKARFIDDMCGYACSDHASWHRQGFHAVTPFEATTETMNRNLHTERDIIDMKSSFQHSNSFTKLAVLFALILGNTDVSAPTF
jgi:bacterial leucyl aminopeptidase